MKPKDLKCPFKWVDRRPLICDRILYVPEHYPSHNEYLFPGWDSPEVFGRKAPVMIEYCSGNGCWIVEKAMQNQEMNWVAVEFQFDRARKIWSKIKNLQLPNLFIVSGEALTFTKHYVKKGEIAGSFVNFPDPWPKDRHAKNRLLQEPFFSELARVSLPDSLLTIATDHRDYGVYAVEGLERSPDWSAVYPAPHYITDYPDYGTSYFDALWRDQGLCIYYIQYKRALLN